MIPKRREVGRILSAWRPALGPLHWASKDGLILQNVHPQHPPHEEQGDDGYHEVVDPLPYGAYTFAKLPAVEFHHHRSPSAGKITPSVAGPILSEAKRKT